MPGYDPAPHAEILYKAIKTNQAAGQEKVVTALLLSLDVYQMDALSDYFAGRYGYQLVDWVPKIPDARLSYVVFPPFPLLSLILVDQNGVERIGTRAGWL